LPIRENNLFRGFGLINLVSGIHLAERPLNLPLLRFGALFLLALLNNLRDADYNPDRDENCSGTKKKKAK
jgi:hypothetical protein